jgi:hypothetical protein
MAFGYTLDCEPRAESSLHLNVRRTVLLIVYLLFMEQTTWISCEHCTPLKYMKVGRMSLGAMGLTETAIGLRLYTKQ